MSENEITREELKTKALLERISQLEDEKADFRVDITWLTHRNRELEEQLESQNEGLDVPEENKD